MADRVIQRNDTAANWQSVNPVLATGELGIVIDGAKGYKIGDGVTPWNDLPYPANPTNVVQELGNDENAVISQKGVTDKLSELGSEVGERTGSTVNQTQYVGYYCSNINNGAISLSSENRNGILYQVRGGDKYKVTGENLLYPGQSCAFYSGLPSENTFVSIGKIRNNIITVPDEAEYMLVSIAPNNGSTIVLKLGWIKDEMLELSTKEIVNNTGGYYEQSFTAVQGSASGNSSFFKTSLIELGDTIEFLCATDSLSRVTLVSSGGNNPTAQAKLYEPNEIYRIIVDNPQFLNDVSFGFYARSNYAISDGEVRCMMRIIKKNDKFSLRLKAIESENQIKDLQEKVKSNSVVLNSISVLPNNNNYIKDWVEGNLLCVRLYVEDKELALSDGLYIRSFFKLSETNYGVTFGSSTKSTILSISPNTGPFEIYENSRYVLTDGTRGRWGKIAIRINWNAIEWTSNEISVGTLGASNFNDIVFDENEFVKPLKAVVKDSRYENYELFSLGDSLSAGGIWQTKVAELIGCVFDQSKNNKAGAMLSVGGTSSYGRNFDNVLWRAKNLIDQGYIQGQGENSIVILENVNDGYNAFDDSVRTIVPTSPIEGYSVSEFTSDLLDSLRGKYSINAVFRLTKTLVGKNLKITSLPTKEGDVTLRVGWSGPGYSNYNVHVVPQASDDLTMKYVLDKILEYAYTGVTDVLGEDGISVDFSSGDANYMTTVEFTDTDNTGMTCVVTDNPNAKTSIAKYFIGDSIDDWTNLSKWQTGITYSQGWKSTIELLMRTYPKLNLFVSLFPMHSVTASEYLLPNGTYDTAAYNKVSRMEYMRKMQVELGNIAKFYSLPFLDVFAECGIGISNMLTYYNASANVHPKNEGYYKFGETIASQLKRYIV